MKKFVVKACIVVAFFVCSGVLYAAEYFGERLNRFDRILSDQQQEHYQNMYLKASGLYKSGEWVDAVNAFDTISYLQAIPFAYRAKAYALTAKMYYFGNHRLEKNYALALDFCNAFLSSRGDFFEEDFIIASLHAGQIYLKGQSGKIERNFERARKHLMDVALSLYASAQDRGSAYLGLGVLYYNGDDKIKKDYASAKEYFNRVLAEGSRALHADIAAAGMFMARIQQIEAQQLNDEPYVMRRRLTI